MAELIEDIYRISVDGDQAVREIRLLIDRVRELERVVGTLDSSTEEYATTTAELAAEQRRLDSVLNQEARTIRELNTLQQAQRARLESLTIGSREYNQQLAALNATQQRLAAATAATETRVGGLRGMFQRASTGAQAFIGVLGGLGIGIGIDAIVGLGSNVVSTIAKFEKLSSVLKNTLGSNSAARAALESIKEFSATTPFQVDEVTETYVKLSNRGLEPTIKQLRLLGDIASSQGKSLDQLTEAILDATGGENERLKEFGIQAKKAGDTVTFAFKGVQKTVANTPAAIRDALLSFGELAGVQGAMAAQSKTLGGAVSNLLDTFDAISVSLGERGVAGIAKTAVDALGGFFGGISDYLKVPLADKIRDEQQEVNALVTAIIASNKQSGERNLLVSELSQKYPELIGFLKIEKGTNEEIALALQAINKGYFDKIRLAVNEERLTDILREQTEIIKEQAETRVRAGKILGAGSNAEAIQLEISLRNRLEAEARANEKILEETLRSRGLSEEKIAKATAAFKIKAADDVQRVIDAKTIAVLKSEQEKQFFFDSKLSGVALKGGQARLKALKEEADAILSLNLQIEQGGGEALAVLQGVQEKAATKKQEESKKKQVDFIKGSLAELEAQLKAAEDILQKKTSVGDVAALDAAVTKIEKIKTQIEKAKDKIAELDGSLSEKGAAAIAALQPKVDSLDFEAQIEKAKQAAEEQKAKIVGTASQRAEQLVLIESNLEKEIRDIQDKEAEYYKDIIDRKAKSTKEQREKELAAEKKLVEELAKIRQTGFETEQQEIEIRSAERETAYNQDITALNDSLKAGLISEKEYNKQREQLDLEYQAAKLQLERELLVATLERLELTAAAENDFNRAQIAKTEAQIAAVDANISGLIDSGKEKAKSFGEAFKSIVDDYVSPIADGITDVIGSIIALTDVSTDRLTSLKEKSKSTLDEMLSNSKEFNAAQVQAEADRLAEITKKEEEAIRRRVILQQALIVVDSIAAIAKAAAQGGVAAPFTIASTLIALAAGIASARSISAFNEGIEYVPLGNNPKGVDTVPYLMPNGTPARLNEGEAIIPTNNVRLAKEAIRTLVKGTPSQIAQLNFAAKNGIGRVTDYVPIVGISQNTNVDMQIQAIQKGQAEIVQAINNITFDLSVITNDFKPTATGFEKVVTSTKMKMKNERERNR